MEAARLLARGDLITEEQEVETVGELDAAMAAFGLVADGPVLGADPVFYLWPDNVEAWDLFKACGTQWRSGTAGREGMDYQGVQIVMRDICGIPRKRRAQRMREVHVMAIASLNEWAKQRAQ